LPNPPQLRKSLFDTVNNRGKVSLNLLSDADVTLPVIDGKGVLVVRVPRADRRQRPVFEGQNPLTGTYRRNYEGDYKCRPDEVGRMLADQSEEPADSRILQGFGLEDLDEESLRQYRQQFADRQPGHPWRSLDDKAFLGKVGAWRRDRQSRDEGLTVAGLMMFGRDEAIGDPSAVPEFHLDYRERLSSDPEVRFTDRLTSDGKWVCNIFQFFQRVQVRLFADLKLPFELDTNLFRRRDETVVHEAIREALVNSLIHADYRGQGGVIIEKYRDRLELSNPGTLLLGIEQILEGGVSECRNKVLQGMFQSWGYGERLGSGIDTIRDGWESQRWRSPLIGETQRPDRVRLVLPMVSLLPEEALQHLRDSLGRRFESLSPLEVQALVTSDVEGQISNARMRLMCREHPADVTKVLQGLVAKGMLEQDGHKRGATYRLSADLARRRAGDLVHSDELAHIGEVDSAQTVELLETLRGVAAPAAERHKLPAEQMRQIILQLCDGRYLSAAEIGNLVRRNPRGLRLRTLAPMVDEGLLQRRFPDEPNRPDQAYTTARRGNDDE